MQYDQFIGEVVNRARLPSQGEAVAAVRATLQTLAERLAGGAADNLAAQLPTEIGEYLRQVPMAELPLRMSLDEFFLRVSEREHVDLPDAIYHARVVMEVVREAVSSGTLENIRAQLPDEYDRLFEATSVGAMPVTEGGQEALTEPVQAEEMPVAEIATTAPPEPTRRRRAAATERTRASKVSSTRKKAASKAPAKTAGRKSRATSKRATAGRQGTRRSSAR